MNLSRRVLIILSLITAIFGGAFCFFIYKSDGFLFDVESTKTLSYSEIIEKANGYAQIFGIIPQNKYVLVYRNDETLKLFALVSMHGYKKLSQLSKNGNYNWENYFVAYSSYPLLENSSPRIYIDDEGTFVGYDAPHSYFDAQMLQNPDQAIDQALEVISRIIDNFSKDYVLINKKQKINSRDGKRSMQLGSIIKQSAGASIDTPQFYIKEDFIYHNSKNDTYVIIGVTNGKFTGFRYDLPISEQYKKAAQRASFASKCIGFSSILITIITLIFFILFLRKRIILRDIRTSSRLSSVLSIFFVITTSFYYYSILPVNSTPYDYGLFTFIFLGVLFGGFCYYKITRYFIGLADGITRQVRPNQITLGDHLDFTETLTSERIWNTIIAYVITVFGLSTAALSLFLIYFLNWKLLVGASYYYSTPLSHVFAAIQAGVLEEVFFRGILFGGLLWIIKALGRYSSYTVTSALVIQAVLFAGAHNLAVYSPPFAHMIVLLPAGIIYGALYYYYGLFTAIVSHIIYDLVLLNLSTSITMFSLVLSIVVFFAPLLFLLFVYLKKGKKNDE